ncbi:MAG: YezD family protein [Chthoniobacteraceae bacterium]|nr:YezD family protein [Chthoniobacteraceae bacterium]
MNTPHSLDSNLRGGASHAPAAPLPHRSTPPWLKLIQEAVEASDFGTVQIKVHGGEVVQIETTRKIRVPSASTRSFTQPTAPAEEY